VTGVDKARTIYITTWETIAVTALPPGWRNRYRDDDGTHHETPCPAILLQEDRGTTKAWDELQGDGQPPRRRSHFTAAEPPYETRAVFADWDGGELCPANDASNYAETHPPSSPDTGPAA